jgi:hypothetical protein
MPRSLGRILRIRLEKDRVQRRTLLNTRSIINLQVAKMREIIRQAKRQLDTQEQLYSAYLYSVV